MRCHFSTKEEETKSVPTGVNIWSTATIPTPNVIKTIENPNENEGECFAGEFSDICNLDPVSVPHKRKILECEKEDFHERLQKIQRKLQLQRASEVVVESMSIDIDEDINDEDEDSDEQDEAGNEEMEWIDQENDFDPDSWDDETDVSFENIKKCSLLCKSKKWRDDRRRLLKISMAKIRGVEDPETYLRRSVLINNTVKRLQKDVSNNYGCHSLSLFQANVEYQSNSSDQWEVEHSNVEVMCKEHINEASASFEFTSSVSNNDGNYSYPEVQTDVPYNSTNFQLSFASSCSSDKSMEGYQLEVLPSINSSFFNKNSLDEQRLNESSLPSRVLKPNSSMHVLSSQPCGLQYRNPAHNEDGTSEYHESNGSTSILDSVVYHSLIASLES